MVRRSNGKSGRRAGQRILDVRVADTDTAREERKFDNRLMSLITSKSLITVQCGATTGTTVSSTTGVFGTITYPEIIATDDFQSIFAQYNEFRIRQIRFDVYDINPNLVAAQFVSTIHVTGGQVPSDYTALQDVIDGPDSGIVPAGTGKKTWLWTASGMEELEFQPTVGGTYVNHGGLRYSAPTAPVTGPKYQVVIKAIVQFRGRR